MHTENFTAASVVGPLVSEMANAILRSMYARFEECLDAKSICGKLFSENLITVTIKELISEATTQDGNGILLDHLYKRGTTMSLVTFATMLSDEVDSPRVQQLGIDLLQKLHQLQDSGCVSYAVLCSFAHIALLHIMQYLRTLQCCQ